ncbi:MAG: hypothetical protein AAFQ27_00405 [Pseudomonadota bacterium]
MTGFAATMLAEIGLDVTVPQPIRAYFEWIEANGLDRHFDGSEGYRHAILDAALEESCMGIIPPDPDHARLWTGATDPDIGKRLVPFCKTGGDGSYAAFWADDAGKTHIVHLGSGSGSTMIGVMADNAVDFLRLLAIGYDELCWPEQHGMTPQEIHEEEYPEEDYEGMEDERPPMPAKPEALRTWVSETFNVTVPERAADIIGEMPDMDGDAGSDPFAQWLATVHG